MPWTKHELSYVLTLAYFELFRNYLYFKKKLSLNLLDFKSIAKELEGNCSSVSLLFIYGHTDNCSDSKVVTELKRLKGLLMLSFAFFPQVNICRNKFILLSEHCCFPSSPKCIIFSYVNQSFILVTIFIMLVMTEIGNEIFLYTKMVGIRQPSTS